MNIFRSRDRSKETIEPLHEVRGCVGFFRKMTRKESGSEEDRPRAARADQHRGFSRPTPPSRLAPKRELSMYDRRGKNAFQSYTSVIRGRQQPGRIRGQRGGGEKIQRDQILVMRDVDVWQEVQRRTEGKQS